jgi:replication factor C subunit 3/5
MNNLKMTKSLSLEDVILDIHKCIMKTKFSDEMKMFLISRMAEIEYRLAQGSNERVQMASLVGAFIEVRSLKTK